MALLISTDSWAGLLGVMDRFELACTTSQREHMSLNGNRFKITNERQPCPDCLGYPRLVLRDGRLVPTCGRCDGAGTVARSSNEKTAPEGGSQVLRE